MHTACSDIIELDTLTSDVSRPNRTDERSCSCRDGVNLKNDERTCVGDVQCPMTPVEVSVDNRCTRYAGVTCDFVCTSGYSKSATISNLTCLTSGAWDVAIGSLCILGTVSPPDSGKSSETLTTGMIVGISVGGIILLVIVVSVVVFCLLQRMREHELSVKYQINKDNADNNCCIGPLDNHDNEKEEVYDEIVEDENYYRGKTEVAKALSESSSTQRYSKRPQEQDDPSPEYLVVDWATGGHSSYLNQKCKDNDNSSYVFDDPYLQLNDDLDQSIENNGYITPQS